MFIDIHAHVYRYPVPFVVRFPNVSEMLERYDKCGVRKACLLPVVNSEIYFPQANEDILEIASQYPDRFIPFCNIDPRILCDSPRAELDKILEYYKAKGCRGVGEIMPNLPTLDARVQNLFRCAEKVGLPVTWDGSDRLGGDFGLYDERGIPQFEATLCRFPELHVFAHGPIFWSELFTFAMPIQRKPVFNDAGDYIPGKRQLPEITGEGVAVRLLRSYPNLMGELSDAAKFLALDEAFAASFLTEFQDKLYFGSDFCCVGMRFGAQELLLKLRDKKLISEEVFQKIACKNAEKYFNL